MSSFGSFLNQRQVIGRPWVQFVTNDVCQEFPFCYYWVYLGESADCQLRVSERMRGLCTCARTDQERGGKKRGGGVGVGDKKNRQEKLIRSHLWSCTPNFTMNIHNAHTQCTYTMNIHNAHTQCTYTMHIHNAHTHTRRHTRTRIG